MYTFSTGIATCWLHALKLHCSQQNPWFIAFVRFGSVHSLSFHFRICSFIFLTIVINQNRTPNAMLHACVCVCRVQDECLVINLMLNEEETTIFLLCNGANIWECADAQRKIQCEWTQDRERVRKRVRGYDETRNNVNWRFSQCNAFQEHDGIHTGFITFSPYTINGFVICSTRLSTKIQKISASIPFLNGTNIF